MVSKDTEIWVNTIKMTVAAPIPLGWLLSRYQVLVRRWRNQNPCVLLVGK